jgi:hypothetical protein
VGAVGGVGLKGNEEKEVEGRDEIVCDGSKGLEGCGRSEKVDGERWMGGG